MAVRLVGFFFCHGRPNTDVPIKQIRVLSFCFNLGKIMTGEGHVYI